MDKALAIANLRELIHARFKAGPERQRWLDWLADFAEAEEDLQKLSELTDESVEEELTRLN